MKYDQYKVDLPQFNNGLHILVKNIVTNCPGVFIAGGAVRSYFDQRKINDYDLFFRDEKTRDEIVKALKRECKLKFECPNGNFHSFSTGGPDIQCIFPRPYSTIEDLLDSFDFTVTQFGFDGTYVYSSIESMRDLVNGRLVLNKLTYPASTIKRIHKYLKYGFKASPELYSIITKLISTKSGDIIDDELVYID